MGISVVKRYMRYLEVFGGIGGYLEVTLCKRLSYGTVTTRCGNYSIPYEDRSTIRIRFSSMGWGPRLPL